MSKLKDERELLSKPGDTILETIEYLKMTQAELAERLGKTPAKVNDIISGKAPITVNTALQLEKVLNIDMQFWLNRETLYREKLARIEQEEFLEQCLDWLKVQPIKELKGLGFIKAERKDTKMVDEMLHFYGVVSPEQWKNVYISQYANTSFRQSNLGTTELSGLSAWLRIGEIRMRDIDLPEFSKERFKDALVNIRELVYSHPEDYAIQVKSLCHAAGVAVIYSPMLPKAPISGATRWIGGNPLLQITDRYKTNDQFWFTFFHEAAHILLHGKKDVFIEDFDGLENDGIKEAEANKFAGNWLLDDKFLEDLSTEINDKEIKAVAKKYRTHPGIVVGRLQKLQRLPYGHSEHLKLKVILHHFMNI